MRSPVEGTLVRAAVPDVPAGVRDRLHPLDPAPVTAMAGPLDRLNELKQEVPEQQMLSTVDARCTIEGHHLGSTKKVVLLTVSCAACGTTLAYGNDEERAVRLSVNNATARPCCDAWRETSDG